MEAVIANYELLCSLTGQMRTAATKGEWEHLLALEDRCSQLLEIIKTQDATAVLDDSARLRKESSIRKILEAHVEIHNLTTPWMAQLQLSMQSSMQEQRLHQAYSSDY